MDCIFCKISSGEAKADILVQDEEVMVFEDIHPQAPVHVLVVPRRHISTVNDMEEGDQSLMGKLVWTARQIAEKKGIAEKGYRLVVNCNKEGGQAVYHLHFHLLGGRALGGKLCKS